MAGYVDYKTANTVPSGGPSPIIWADCPVVTFIRDPGKGVHLFEDFLRGTVANDTDLGAYFSLVGTNPDCAMVTDEANGVLNISGSGAQYDEAYIRSNLLCNEAIKKNSRKKVWFETKLKIEDHDADLSIIAGLGEDSLLAADAIEDSVTPTALADYDFVGFVGFTGGTSLGDIDAVYHQDGDGGTPTAVAEAIDDEDLADDTYYRLGFKFDGKSAVTFYVNGVALGTTLDVDDLTGDKLDDALGIIVGVKDAAGSITDDVKVDWIRFACEK